MAGEQYSGFTLNAVDAKARVSVPAWLRAVLDTRTSPRALTIAPSEYDDCLIGYDKDHEARLRAEIELRFAGDYSRERAAALRRAFGRTVSLNVDDGYRITLTPLLRELAGVEKHVYFVGSGEYFEIWNPAKFLAQEGLDEPSARICRYEMSLKGEVA
ncbi:division/cell wall cluster transcriptional repressor MraZ [Glacieibacterium sp.]|uniref:division/cell wall cluster transcriptional repressor MraZ n=1 Tax=Glacieibacterium sp. TaxID=2860237 RepID=UPI003B006B51